MKFGVVYPQTELGQDPTAIRDYAQTAEGLGFSHILAYEHVLGANPDRPGGWQGPYTHQHTFMEPFVLFSFLAGQTEKIGFTTGILILPQRQTVLVAKQAACLDVLCSGRLRLGVGLGWNKIEYIALGQEFHTRGRRIEEQVEVMRLLWKNSLVDFDGKWHRISDAGLNPMPLARSIPVWFGGHAEQVLQRAARLGDGWMPNYRSPVDAQPALDMLDEYLVRAGRDRIKPGMSDQAGFGLEARIPYGEGNPDEWQRLIDGWNNIGASHISFNTMGAGLNAASDHIRAIQRIAQAVGVG
jgi:probable F420-dependent oxidoreductase